MLLASISQARHMGLDRSFEPIKSPVRYYRFGGRQHWMYSLFVQSTKFGVPLTAPACSGPDPTTHPPFSGFDVLHSSPPHNTHPTPAKPKTHIAMGHATAGLTLAWNRPRSRDRFANFIGFTCDASHYFLFRSSGIKINQLCIPAGFFCRGLAWSLHLNPSACLINDDSLFIIPFFITASLSQAA